jgi:hypothetical protein
LQRIGCAITAAVLLLVMKSPAPTRATMPLANIGIGDGAIDAGGSYTYLNPATGNEFSGVV